MTLQRQKALLTKEITTMHAKPTDRKLYLPPNADVGGTHKSQARDCLLHDQHGAQHDLVLSTCPPAAQGDVQRKHTWVVKLAAPATAADRMHRAGGSKRGKKSLTSRESKQEIACGMSNGKKKSRK